MRRYLFALVVFLLIFSASLALADDDTITLQSDISDYLPAEGNLTGILNLTTLEIISNDSTLKIYVDDELVKTKSMREYLNTTDWNDFSKIKFYYKIFADGNSSWQENKYHAFEFDGYVDCSKRYFDPEDGQYYNTPYYQEFHSSGIVSRADNLKYIAYVSIVPPDTCNETITEDCCENEPVWNIQSGTLSTTNVDIALREACGEQDYNGTRLDEYGWVPNQVLDFSYDSENNVYSKTLPRFDNRSLNNSNIFIPWNKDRGSGAITETIENFEGEAVRSILSWGEVIWNGDTGELIIDSLDYNLNADYTAKFLPPNGKSICAFTNKTVKNSTDWLVSTSTIPGQVSYDEDYTYIVEVEQIETKTCDDFTGRRTIFDCNDTLKGYRLEELDVPECVDLSFDAETMNVTATTNCANINNPIEILMDLNDFDIEVPENLTNHTIRFELLDEDTLLANSTYDFTSCSDRDNDGYCEESGDCNDSKSSINPDADELCDGLDNNCDGDIDEDFTELGEMCGEKDSACEGIYICAPNKTAVICNNTLKPGDQLEICDNEIDDDCDGFVDEDGSFSIGGELQNCTEYTGCEEGDTKPCDIPGLCGGYKICENGEWSEECENYTLGTPEKCNNIDDDCDGIVDNTAHPERCGCYEGSPSTEICNDVDDDCDGFVDEDACECDENDIPQRCGENIGICTTGHHECINGMWDTTECVGAVEPDPHGELCYNNLDDDCDGDVDEGDGVFSDGCTKEITCSNGFQDVNEIGVDCGSFCGISCTGEPEGEFPLWIIIVIVVVIIAVVFLLLMKKGIISFSGKEVEEEELPPKEEGYEF